MEPLTNENLATMAVSLANLAVKGTASAVNKKIKAIREEKNIDNLRATYDEITNEILLEREEAVRIAQAYKSEIDRIQIKDEDIEHLHKTVEKILEIINKSQMKEAEKEGEDAIEKAREIAESLNQIKDLISVDTLKTMQLLGFNYKAAIGDPLTQLCALSIINWGSSNNIEQ